MQVSLHNHRTTSTSVNKRKHTKGPGVSKRVYYEAFWIPFLPALGINCKSCLACSKSSVPLLTIAQDACCYDDECGILLIGAWWDVLEQRSTGRMVAGDRALRLGMIRTECRKDLEGNISLDAA